MSLLFNKNMLNEYLNNYRDVPLGTAKIIPLVVIESIAMCVSYFISIYLVNALHFSPFQVGKLISSLSLGTCIGSVFSGYLTTKISAMKVSAFGLFIYSIGFFLLSFITSYTYLLFILFLCGVGGVFMMIANLTALIKLTNDDTMKNRIIVLQSVIFNISASIGGFFMSFLRADLIKHLFLIFSVLLIISGCYVLSLKEPIKKEVKIVNNQSIKLNISLLVMILPVIFFYGVIYSLIKIYFPVEAVSRFENPFISWLMLSANPILIIFIQPLLMNKLKNQHNIVLLASGAFFLGCGYVLFGISSYILPSLIFILFAAVGEMIFSPISKKLAASAFGLGNEGIGLASWKMTYYFSGISGAIFVGYMGENYQYLNIWYVCIPLSLAMLFCIIGYGVFIEKNKDVSIKV